MKMGNLNSDQSRNEMKPLTRHLCFELKIKPTLWAAACEAQMDGSVCSGLTDGPSLSLTGQLLFLLDIPLCPRAFVLTVHIARNCPFPDHREVSLACSCPPLGLPTLSVPCTGCFL